MMSSSLVKILLLNSSFLASVVGVAVALFLYLTMLPLIQGLSMYDKKKWLQKQFAELEFLSADQILLKKRLLESAEPSDSFPMYKALKFILIVSGLIGFFGGFILLILPEFENITPEAYDKILFIPLIIGLVIYFIYQTFFRGQGLLREVSGFFLFLGILSTVVMAYFNFELTDWLRIDVLGFLILSLGLLIVFHLNSILVSFLYMLAVTCCAISFKYLIEENSLIFLPQLLWVFGALILYFWLPKLRNAKDIGPREIIFAVLFMSMVLALSTFQLSGSLGLYVPISVVVLPGLYLFSRVYFRESSSIFGRPIEVFSILAMMIFGFLMTFQSFSEEVKGSIFLFENYSFAKQFSYLILLTLLVGVFYIYNEHFSEKRMSLNPGIIGFPLFIFLVTYFLPPALTSLFILSYLIWMGYGYLSVGVRMKSELKLYMGVSILLSAMFIKFFEVFADDLDGNKNMLSLSLIFLGSLLIGLVFVIREKWRVTGPIENQVTES